MTEPDIPVIPLTFLPDADRGRLIDRRMRSELAASLTHIRLQLQEQVDDADILDQLPALDSLCDRLRGEDRVSPAVFGRYYQLVFAILADEDTVSIRRKLCSLTDAFDLINGMNVRDLDETGLGDKELVALYQRSFDTDMETSYGFLPPDVENSCRMRNSISSAMALMREAVPDLYGEIDAIVSEILLASAPKTEDAPRFDGASTYLLWGALALNADNEKSDIEMVGTLAHECGHCLLFGLTIDEPLVHNDDTERYSSPLRDDPRPMDGIYHATFVSARMHYAMQQLLQSQLLSAAQKAECEKYLESTRQSFREGYKVVAGNASYSKSGYEIMQNAYEYMQEVSESAVIT